MAPKYTISEEDRVVCLYYEGPATFEEWKESMDQIIHDKRFQANFRFLIDQRAVPPTDSGFRATSRWLSSLPRTGIRRRPQIGDGRGGSGVFWDGPDDSGDVRL